MSGFFASEAVQSDRPLGLIPKCGACGLFKTCRSPKMEPYGEGHTKVLVVGEAPGEGEDEEGRPFVGKAGIFLRERLEEIRVDLDSDAWTTNAIICRPPKNKTPDERQLGYCRPNLEKTIQGYRPNVIVTLGRSALASVLMGRWFDIGPLERWVGWRMPFKDYWVCPTWHPSYLMRMQNEVLNRSFSDHLEAAFSIECPPGLRHHVEEPVRCLYEEDAIVAAIRSMHEDEGWIAVDYETNCLKPEWPEGRIVSCALANRRTIISYPWLPQAATATGILLTSPRTKKIASNLKFEERWTRKEFGRGVANWGWDTMLATHCLDNRKAICSIKFQALVQLGQSVYNRHIEPFMQNSRGPYNRVEQIPLAELLLYGGRDAELEYVIAGRQRKEMGYED